MAYSEKCPDPTYQWKDSACVLCIHEVKPGFEVTPNCGMDDEGSKHEKSTRECKDNFFNDGRFLLCQPCSSCRDVSLLVTDCNSTTDTICRNVSSTVPPTTTPEGFLLLTHPLQWAVIILLSILLAAFSVYIIKRKRNNGQHTAITYCRKPSCTNPSFSNIDDTLDDNVLSAPLQTVLDNLDVLEELVILLDPETSGMKNTKHLASLCSFPSTWITYTYSMRDIRSPLKAVLESVGSRNPDWTVGHLVELLRDMKRNDAIAALAKLKVHQIDV